MHKSFSLFVFRPEKNSYECLLVELSVKDRRKGIWSSTCWGHADPDESIIDSCKSKLKQELGIEAADIKEIGLFNYKEEIHHVLIGYDKDQKIIFNVDGADGYLWLDLDTIKKDFKDSKIKDQVGQDYQFVQYSGWFEEAFSIAISGLKDISTSKSYF